MFGNSSKTEEAKKSPSQVSSASPNAVNTLVKGTVAEGLVKCENDLRVDGTIKGKLHCSAKVIIGPSGRVEGEIRCQNAVIEGAFSGILRVSELLNIRESASVDGDIFTNKLVVQSGAKFNVACQMDPNAAANGASKHPDLKNTQAHATTAAVAGGKAEIRN